MKTKRRFARGGTVEAHAAYVVAALISNTSAMTNVKFFDELNHALERHGWMIRVSLHSLYPRIVKRGPEDEQE